MHKIVINDRIKHINKYTHIKNKQTDKQIKVNETEQYYPVTIIFSV